MAATGETALARRLCGVFYESQDRTKSVDKLEVFCCCRLRHARRERRSGDAGKPAPVAAPERCTTAPKGSWPGGTFSLVFRLALPSPHVHFLAQSRHDSHREGRASGSEQALTLFVRALQVNSFCPVFPISLSLLGHGPSSQPFPKSLGTSRFGPAQPFPSDLRFSFGARRHTIEVGTRFGSMASRKIAESANHSDYSNSAACQGPSAADLPPPGRLAFAKRVGELQSK
jgi:hypothetical protein